MSCERCRPKRRSAAELTAQVEAWNKHRPIGASVEVKRDNGTISYTVTTSAAWLLGGHTPVIMLRGISGCYALDRVKPV